MKIRQFELVDRCLFWKEKKMLIAGDIHLGYEEALMQQGMSFPKTQMEETLSLFKKIFKVTGKLKKIVLLGDVKHYFAGMLRDEKNDFLNLVELLKKDLVENGKIIITKGNHDVILEPITKNYNFVKLVDFFKEEKVLFLHGDEFSFKKGSIELFDRKTELIVSGHFHSAISIKEDIKIEKFKCFLYGKNKTYKKEMIILPSFFPLIEGYDVTQHYQLTSEEGDEKLDVSNFKVYVLTGEFGEILDFGKVESLRPRPDLNREAR